MRNFKRPNILFILTDQHRHDFSGFAGHEQIRTPNLDRLAKSSIIFDNTYCQNPLCVPSRSSMLTGKYSKNIGIYENQDILDPLADTIPGILSRNGYRSCLIGKAHFNGDQYHGYQQRPYGDIFGQGHQPDPCHTGEGAGLGNMIENAGASGIPLALTQTEICVAEAAKWLQEHKGLHSKQPFMLSINFDKPHFPLKAPEIFLKNYRDKIVPQEFRDKFIKNQVPYVRHAAEIFKATDRASAVRALEAYCACIEWVDDAIGRILSVLDYLKLKDNTIIIYSSDHGELAGDWGAWNKTLFFDACNKVPLLISNPLRFNAGHCSELTGLVDLFPTICDLCGVTQPDSLDGMSLLSLLEGKGNIERTDGVFSESAFLSEPEFSGCMLRRGEWKYNYYIDGAEELYNMEKDPGEQKNLVQEQIYREIVDELRQKLLNFWKPEIQQKRICSTPKVPNQKHWYQYSNQFITGNGTIFDGRP